MDKAIREAQERGEFDNLPGAGKPLPGAGEGYREDWWLKQWIQREQITGAVPATLLLRRDVEDVDDAIARCRTESEVRRLVDALNERIVKSQRGYLDGPPVVLKTLDPQEFVRRWFARRGEG
ncbi:DUF1992 domain-containing protein [Allorhizocola rhizosphaerae]|uniref:DnaJ family domain-containing protein n=1 Tax=Allorhizocola rhizosphaerae TaxID=1872709 RepID=UPI001FE9EAC8|nr:DUF1992 domain-containing protein [Allorhizocola rhizosphaerae]